MSSISNIYDALETEITSTLASHTELLNPYNPVDDSNLNLTAAYGIVVADGGNSRFEQNTGGAEQRQRTFEVILSRRKFATKSDTAERKSTEKQLLEDWTLLCDAIAQNRTLNGECIFCDYQNDGGIEFLRSNRVDILIIRTVFSVEYEEEVILCP